MSKRYKCHGGGYDFFILDILHDPIKFGISCNNEILGEIQGCINYNKVPLEDYYISTYKKVLKREEEINMEVSESNLETSILNAEHNLRFFLLYETAIEIGKFYRLIPYVEMDYELALDFGYRNKNLYNSIAKVLVALGVFNRWFLSMGSIDHLDFPYQKIEKLNRSMLLDQFPIIGKMNAYFDFIRESWDGCKNYINKYELSWKSSVDIGDFEELDYSMVFEAHGLNDKSLYFDMDGNLWLCKYDTECLYNPVLVSILHDMVDCPGSRKSMVKLAYDPNKNMHCSIQPLIENSKFYQFKSKDIDFYRELIGGSFKKANQLICQSVIEWLLGNINGYQVIHTHTDDLFFIDQDRSFFYPEENNGQLDIFRFILKASLEIDGVYESLFSFVNRIENIPDDMYMGIIYRSSCEANLIFPLMTNTMLSQDILGSNVEKLSAHWEKLKDRKVNVKFYLKEIVNEI